MYLKELIIISFIKKIYKKTEEKTWKMMYRNIIKDNLIQFYRMTLM